MTAGLVHVANLSGGSFGLPAGAVSFHVLGTGFDGRIAIADYGYGVTRMLEVNGQGVFVPVSETPHAGAARVSVSIAGEPGSSLSGEAMTLALEGWDAGQGHGTLGYLDQGHAHGDAAVILGARIGGEDLILVAPMAGSGLTSVRLNGGGGIAGTQGTADSATSYLAGVSALAVVEQNGESYVYAGSALDHGISGFRIGPGGTLAHVVDLGMEQRLPVQQITALEPVTINGAAYLVVAAAGSSSLSVLRVLDGGALAVTDHLIDSLETRFAGVTHLEVVQYDGQTYVLAAGADDGLSLFALSAEGMLVHLDSIADSTNWSMDGVSGLAAVVVDNQLEVVVTAEGEAGLSQFRVDLSGYGTFGGTAGGAGDDVVVGTMGADTLTGGAGEDVFVLMPDGQRDVITDIRPGVDRLDLSAWSFFRNTGQLEVIPTATGAILRFGAEELELRQAGGGALTLADVLSLIPEIAARVEVDTGILLRGDPEPVPDPDPTPNPAPAPDPGPGPTPINLTGTAGPDHLIGGAGHDGLKGEGGNDTLEGLDGDDRLPGADGDDVVMGGAGNDQMGGGYGNDLLDGGDGNDRGGGGPGDDTLNGAAGNDVLSGGPGEDMVSGGTGHDVLAGSFGSDTVNGHSGDDSLGGGPGFDSLHGGDGNDTIGAGDHDDTLIGGSGDDFLGGGDGDDLLRGGTGMDTLNGGNGDDRLTGGADADVFVFNNRFGDGADVITDFQDGVDMIRLVGLPVLADPMARVTITDVATGAEVVYGNFTITVEGVAAADLTVDDFLFT